jgi:hypothetical protein
MDATIGGNGMLITNIEERKNDIITNAVNEEHETNYPV